MTVTTTNSEGSSFFELLETRYINPYTGELSGFPIPGGVDLWENEHE